uniref:Uncharacterized protein n=1 Tax=Rhizophagus irregularis (strain DAOM 181602 / DAOM 197198 / MUCL 43194) TaxID=747089 RepID=U9SUN4_RHIID
MPLPVYVCRFRVPKLEVQYVLSWPAYLIARSAPSHNPTIAGILCPYLLSYLPSSEKTGPS